MASVGIGGFYRQKKRGGGGVAKPNPKRSSTGKSAAIALSFTDPDQSLVLGAIAEHGKTASAVAFEEERLRQFDLDMRYGPCLGLSRMERWDRAAAMGLNPPADVEAILLKSSAAAADCHWEGRI
ncbi:hypothetical protein OPV22_000404 [Ensete ventricosum]|uniref:DNA polymerase delta subunit 4 n=1 Tax=Ensete ventricosum TaxID=4639 RepID=A0AAV8RP91_ENSVE|nr:hypothetical protein OPV22_000404 [Ensete ventricosum]